MTALQRRFDPNFARVRQAIVNNEAITMLPGAEAYDTANIIVKFANGKCAQIDVCRQAPYGYDRRAEVLGTKAR
jgi:predicted dehydrogenase